MKVKVLSDYFDKDTGHLHIAGNTAEYEKEARVKELASSGFVDGPAHAGMYLNEKETLSQKKCWFRARGDVPVQPRP